MSSKYIVRQPIKNQENRIIGYEIQYHGENNAFGGENGAAANDFAAADTIYNFLTMNTDKLLRGALHFMTFTTTLLMKKSPRLFDKNELVIQIDDSVLIHPLAMHMIQQYAKEGDKIAVNEFQFAPRYLAMLDSIDYIKLNFHTTPELTLKNIIEIAHSMNKKCIAVGIDNEDLYQRAVKLNIDAMEGTIVAEKMTYKTHNSGYMQSNFFRLVVAVVQDEPDVEEIERIISVDATLTCGLLRIANSRYFSLHSKVTNVRQAIMTIGLNELKQWVYLLSASNAENQMEDGAEEFLKLSLMRANFCSSLMDYAQNISITKPDAYLMGMFSTLNYLIDAPLEEILQQIPLSQEVKDALLRHSGRSGMLYDLALCYERADWAQIDRLAGELGIQTNLLTSLYFSCMEDVNRIWSEITQVSGKYREELVTEQAD
ncbi:MAG: HDOD domain-containing protein [Pseudoflavonifractor capillosus]|uniref:EAL and HDOD domain-containing protein n=1 Tax=Pseudoflavonifractor capillosus TaxID=106588 RepID=UPI0023F99365|nr:HDOD domain-containing protein [Pseudoflavonifractor capillosus]MCI5928809.1 HDOD domain-containing protein [Pseudoflavonifractor capillosus]MDY4660293.1 HDOD domain-containing protein [Pseudoflavonifractor capillosus]